jgi:hypothetical protein
MEEAPEKGEELSYSAHANGMNEWTITNTEDMQAPQNELQKLLHHFCLPVHGTQQNEADVFTNFSHLPNQMTFCFNNSTY